MFRKIPSNRDPKATIYSELKKEFGTYFTSANERGRHFIQAYPKPVFWGMLLLLLFSAVLSFTVFRKPPAKNTIAAAKTSVKKPVLDDGFERILATGAALQRTLQLKNKVDALLSKGKLSRADSLSLESALDSLGQIQHQINQP